MTQAATQGSTTTYSYDFAGNRVSQTVGSTTTIYPNKFYSITSTTNGATTYATTTVYVWNGDTLIATIDQPLINGSATGTAATRYIHPDHLGSTNIVSDESGSVVTSEEYYPYGETRYNEVNYPTNEKRQYIGQFKDGNSLAYLNARYYDSNRGQFMSEDPIFLSAQQTLNDPQSLNSYSYAEDNPTVRKDPSGLTTYEYVRSLNTSSPGENLYGHAFAYVVPSPGEVLPALYSNGMCIDTSHPFTLSGFPVGGAPGGYLGKLTMQVSNPADYNQAIAKQRLYGTVGMKVNGPGMNDSQTDAAVVQSFNALSTDQGFYNPLAIFGSSNSNNANTSIMLPVLGRSQFNNVQSTLTSQLQRPAPGLGTPVAANTLSNIAYSLQTILQELRQLQSGSTKQPSR